jgi:hypothetical protein
MVEVEPHNHYNHRSMNGDLGWGIIAEREGEISGRTSLWPTIYQRR